jgi:hypothetical protein
MRQLWGTGSKSWQKRTRDSASPKDGAHGDPTIRGRPSDGHPGAALGAIVQEVVDEDV